jgi:alkylation response protein AidB-like acyl-CoA dehydrogenase
MNKLMRTSAKLFRSKRIRFFSSDASHSPLCTLSDEEQMIKESVSRFAHDVVKPKVRQMDEAAKMDVGIVQQMFSNGFMSVEIPSEYGGSGSSFLASCLAVEEMAKIDPSVSVCLDVHNTLVNNVFSKWASDDMKSRIWPRLAKDTLGAFALSEAGSGSDAFALRTTATKKGDYYLINGTKQWITNGNEAGIFLVMANVDPSAGYKGITCFVVDRNTPGFKVHAPENKLGIRASSTTPLSFDDVKVHESSIVGKVGIGYKIAIEILNEGRIGIAAQMLGIAQGAFDVAVPYTFERKQFGSFIGDFQSMQHQIAQAAVDIEAARLLVYNAARLKMNNQSFVKEAAMAKLFASKVAESVASKSIEWMGGVGFTKEYGVEKFYRDAKIGAIYEGTSNIQLSTIGKILTSQYKK